MSYDMEESEDRFRELEDKIEALEELIEQGSESPETTDEFIDVQSTGVEDFRLFWVNIDDVEAYETCEEVDSVAKAQLVFAEYATTRNGVKNGDVLVLLCNNATQPEEEEESESEVPPVCYYIGMCIRVHTSNQQPSESEIPAYADQHEFIAWDSCGGATDGLTEDIEFKELLDPSGSYVTYGEPGSDGLRTVTINLPTKKRSMVFKKGLLVEHEEGSLENLQISFTDLSGEDEDKYDEPLEIEVCDNGVAKTVKVQVLK